MALYASQGSFGNGTESHGWVWLKQLLETPCYQSYQGNSHSTLPGQPYTKIKTLSLVE